MRRLARSAIALFLAAAALVAAPSAYAQRGGDDGQAQADEAAKKQRSKEWDVVQAPLPGMRNSGPCPFVKSLYDAARYVEFKDNREATASVAYSGEIERISAGCSYRGDEPIKVVMDVLFQLGKGPQATSNSKTYRYWIAVTERNTMVITKQYFDLPAKFGDKDRIYVTEKISNIVIPRAKDTTSGGNFEILIGFDVTPEMAEFNRFGKRFRAAAGTGAVTGTTSAAAPQ
ncbi:Tat pathway signal sequence domain protein [Phenylobacterium immobile]|uniref:Tat pathway signal sequence domain protein n=1 Tax=Phenylobacterium immobile TaxID=21 RepID=UPI000AA77293|nr:Tat pathway signal sequence domain protein [Phenylobacterium immobile]